MSVHLNPPSALATSSWREVVATLVTSRSEMQRLSPAERMVAEYILQGLSNREIARALGKSMSTVKTQVSACLAKCGVPSRARFIALLR
jgi:DNA-binding NarL/FixJ family response regulator